MNLSKRAIYLVPFAIALAPFASTASAQPVWSDVMYAQNDLNAASGNYFPVGGGTAIYQTDLMNLPTPFTLNVANVTLPTTTNYTWNCGATNSSPGTSLNSTALTFVETYRGDGIKGVGFQGAFTNKFPFALTVAGQATNVIQAVFFNENQCYGVNGVGGGDEWNANGREYGFSLYSLPQNDNNIYA
jgi:hypothetical protein